MVEDEVRQTLALMNYNIRMVVDPDDTNKYFIRNEDALIRFLDYDQYAELPISFGYDFDP